MKKTLLSLALAGTLGVSTAASAAVWNFTAEGFFTMITPTGGVLTNPDAAGAPGGDLFGVNTPLSGLKLSFDTATGQGTGSVDPFLFSGTVAAAHDINMQAIGDGDPTTNPGMLDGTLVFGTMLFDYGPTLDIPVYLIADAAGLFGAIQGGLTPGQVITGGATPSTDAAIAASPYGLLVPGFGPSPFAMTTWDVNQDGDADNQCGTTGGTGALIGGGFPLCDDGVSGVRMATAPFPGHMANFNMTSLTVAAVPVPAAVWLFGSGLLGLVGVARRKKTA